MKSLKNTIFEIIIFFGACFLALLLYKRGMLPNMPEGVAKAVPYIALLLLIGLIFIVIISYLKYRELKNNPESREVFEIYDNDERNIYLKDKANSKVYVMINIIEVPLSLVLLFTGFSELGVGLMIFHCVKEVLWSVIHTKLSKQC